MYTAATGRQWRRGWDLHPRITVLQTAPLLLGYHAKLKYDYTDLKYPITQIKKIRQTNL